MHASSPPLNALRAFEAAARHLSFSRAAEELHVTPGALSHQIRGLEEFLGLQLFERQTRAVALTVHGKALYPGLQAGFGLIRDAVAGLRPPVNEHVLVISTPPGLTSKWLAARLYRFVDAHPGLDVRISSTIAEANFINDGIDAAVRNLADGYSMDPALSYDALMRMEVAAVCSPRLLEKFDPIHTSGVLERLPLIHDESLIGRAGMPTWSDWEAATGRRIGDASRGLRFTSADHAINAALEGAGLLLAQLPLAHDDLRSGRLSTPFNEHLPSGRAYYFVTPKARAKRPAIAAFGAWLREEVRAAGMASAGLAG